MDWRARLAEPIREPSPAMQRIFAEIERSTAQGIYEGHKRLARRYLREQPVTLSSRAMRILGRFARAQQRLAFLREALEEVE